MLINVEENFTKYFQKTTTEVRLSICEEILSKWNYRKFQDGSAMLELTLKPKPHSQTHWRMWILFQGDVTVRI